MLKKEDEDENGLPTIVVKDSKSKKSWARVLKKKGVESYTIKVMKKFLSLMGYKRVIMKSDNEPAILALKEEIKKNVEVEIVPEESPHMIPKAMVRLKGKFRLSRSSLGL